MSPSRTVCLKERRMPTICVEYRELNTVFVCYSYSISIMEEFTDSLGDVPIFTKYDANHSYWQVKIDDANGDKTSFTLHLGLFRLPKVPFRLPNALDTFRETMEVIFLPIKSQFSLVYLDDIIIVSLSVDRHTGDGQIMANHSFSFNFIESKTFKNDNKEH